MRAAAVGTHRLTPTVQNLMKPWISNQRGRSCLWIGGAGDRKHPLPISSLELWLPSLMWSQLGLKVFMLVAMGAPWFSTTRMLTLQTSTLYFSAPLSLKQRTKLNNPAPVTVGPQVLEQPGPGSWTCWMSPHSLHSPTPWEEEEKKDCAVGFWRTQIFCHHINVTWTETLKIVPLEIRYYIRVLQLLLKYLHSWPLEIFQLLLLITPQSALLWGQGFFVVYLKSQLQLLSSAPVVQSTTILPTNTKAFYKRCMENLVLTR